MSEADEADSGPELDGAGTLRKAFAKFDREKFRAERDAGIERLRAICLANPEVLSMIGDAMSKGNNPIVNDAVGVGFTSIIIDLIDCLDGDKDRATEGTR